MSGVSRDACLACLAKASSEFGKRQQDQGLACAGQGIAGVFVYAAYGLHC